MINEDKSAKKGIGFEYLVSGMFQSQGYLTRRGIPFNMGFQIMMQLILMY